jgi:hypothetical protein
MAMAGMAMVMAMECYYEIEQGQDTPKRIFPFRLKNYSKEIIKKAAVI